MARGKTLWEMLVSRFQGPAELTYYNPLRARVGVSLMINDIDLKDHNFFVREIRSYRRWIGGRWFPFVDYVLLARPLGGDDVLVRLRLLPIEGADPATGPAHHVIVLSLYDEFAYDQGFHGVVTDTTKKFEVIEEGRETEEYWRINDVVDSYKAEVAVFKDLNKDGTVDANEVAAHRLEYWDYWRETTDEAGQPVRQYLFVEMDADSGWFQLWRGREMDAHQIITF